MDMSGPVNLLPPTSTAIGTCGADMSRDENRRTAPGSGGTQVAGVVMTGLVVVASRSEAGPAAREHGGAGVSAVERGEVRSTGPTRPKGRAASASRGGVPAGREGRVSRHSACRGPSAAYGLPTSAPIAGAARSATPDLSLIHI